MRAQVVPAGVLPGLKTLYSEKLSPFSPRQNYAVRTFYRPRPFGDLTPREVLVRTVLDSCGAAAALTLERFWPKGKGQVKLKSLAAAGFMAKHVLDGNIRLNVYSFHPRFDLDQGLRQLALAQFYVRLREHVPCYLTPAEPFPVLTVMGRHFQVVVLRDGDPKQLVLPFLSYPTVIICETLVSFPERKVRLTTDYDLLGRPLEECFYLPDGTPDRRGFFVRLSQMSIFSASTEPAFRIQEGDSYDYLNQKA